MKNFTLYSHPLIPYEEENSLTIYIKTDCDDYSLNLKLITLVIKKVSTIIFNI